MERATRWFKGLFGIRSKKNDTREYSVHRWTSGDARVLCHNPTTIPPNITPAEAAWLRSFYSEPDSEQNKHARAVAAATAAAADAAVAAAHAAAVVVRLTCQNRGNREKWAAANIQRVFRGFLARKALRALKGLVKIQALVRGFLVRKQAAAALLSMQALIRVQASVRAQRTRRILNNDETFPPLFQARKSLEKFDEDPTLLAESRRLSSFEATKNAFDDSPKIVEVDTGCWPKSRSRRANTWISDSGTDDSSAKAISCPFPVRICQNLAEREWGLTGEECNFGTAQNTPRFASSVGTSPGTPAESSAYAESHLSSFGPSYVGNTQSFKAKQRSQSAPKQRPDPGPNRRVSVHQRSGARAQEYINFKNAVVGKLGRSSSFVRQTDFN